ncbi:N-acetylmuramoyl-L-alanine amidase [Fulvivirga ulvae]|uniref:N-acetylmuramoyl-L-alanine amidase n=1 Tax=Fulvivirga ulvae TaxID=2904245 RepID=UPI001F3C3927|nr:N-acetylmuramoyl-L-alanine amidase [Fulvivirga ulvae]UII29992.1 N-acetylmuramoyl-L-alanine amidase [Fulvivirga ulvae]
MRKYLWVLVSLFILSTGNAQQEQWRKAGSNTRILQTTVGPQQTRAFAGFEATGIAIKYEGTLGEAYVATGSKVYSLTPDEHYQEKDKSTNLLIFDISITHFELFTGNMNGNIEVVIINAGSVKGALDIPRLNQQQDECSMPVMVDQSVWRAGLPEPSYNRSFTVTENIIIHHSATSNEADNYADVVRNIYIYHTQGNGWSDIGYNYLIAPDGTIFKGRDPGSGEQDKVIGAHFCGKNSTTMGICLMGTYTEIPPSEETLAALDRLLAWKSDKDNLDPFGQNSHPLNASLPVIAGHRDGCSTECPGQKTYDRLSEIRYATAETMEACGEEESPAFSLYPNPASSYFKVALSDSEIHKFELYDMRGLPFNISPTVVQNGVATFSTGSLVSGMYILHYQSEGELIKRRLIISN